MNQHAKAGIRLIRTVLIHGFLPFHPWERRLDINSLNFLHDPLDQAFGNRLDVFWRGKAHFGINLRKFRLPVSPQVLVPETASQLVVLVYAGRHQQLLKELW